MQWPEIFFWNKKPLEEYADGPSYDPARDLRMAEVPPSRTSSKNERVIFGSKGEFSAVPSSSVMAAVMESGQENSSESTPTPPLPGATSLRRKAKLTDVARIVETPEPDVAQMPPPFVPPASEPSMPPPPSAPPSAAVVPPSFTVTMAAGNVIQAGESKAESNGEIKTAAPEVKTAPVEKPVVEEKPADAPKADLPAHAPEKKEFLLTNGERILGRVLNETPEAVYLDHGTLGVITIPRAQIAQRPVEIILINGDRIVGDIMAETPDTLYVRHASLGMLTVPRAQRSTRVVEAILKDGDRILGEVLAETDSFTVIRSGTLGTVTVPHGKVTMFNRKIEQIELKSLPPSAPELKDKAG